jgi:hypothetical protein
MSLNLCRLAFAYIGRHTPARAPARAMRGGRTCLADPSDGPVATKRATTALSLADSRNVVQKTKAAHQDDPHLVPPA